MIKIIKKIFFIIMIILAFFQIFCINNMKKVNTINVYKTQNKSYSYKSFEEISNDLNFLKEKNIISAKNSNGKWQLKLQLAGNKDELIDQLTKLKEYNIINYIIAKDQEEINIIVDIENRTIS